MENIFGTSEKLKKQKQNQWKRTYARTHKRYDENPPPPPPGVGTEALHDGSAGSYRFKLIGRTCHVTLLF